MPEPRRFYPAANPAFCWIMGIFIGLFGAGFLFLGINALDHSPLEGGGQALFGLVILFFAWRAANFYRRPVFALTDEAIEQKPFWGLPRKTPFDQIDKLGLYYQTNEAKVFSPDGKSYKTGQQVMSQHLVVTLTSGKSRTIVLPAFDNDALLDDLKARSGKSIEMLPAREAG